MVCVVTKTLILLYPQFACVIFYIWRTSQNCIWRIHDFSQIMSKMSPCLQTHACFFFVKYCFKRKRQEWGDRKWTFLTDRIPVYKYIRVNSALTGWVILDPQGISLLKSENHTHLFPPVLPLQIKIVQAIVTHALYVAAFDFVRPEGGDKNLLRWILNVWWDQGRVWQLLDVLCSC